MNTNTKNQIYTFGTFRMDPLRRLLFGPDGEQFALKPKDFDTLLCLVEHAGEVLSKAELMEAVWGNRIVEENSLSKHISTLRHVLGEAPGEHRFIVTEPGHGYRFVATVCSQARMDAEATETPSERFVTESIPIDSRPVRRTGGIALAAVACSALLAGVWWNGSADLTSTESETIAVLGFSDLSPDSDNEIIAEGMTVDLTTLLGTAPSLRVTAPNSALSFRNSDAGHAEIGATLGVEYLLEGTVRITDDQMRVTASLVEARSGMQVWSYPAETRPMTDVFSIQNEIATAVARWLGSTVAEVPGHYVTDKREVYEAYNQARHINRVRAMNGLERARRLLEQAIRDDPNYLPARYELLTTFLNLPAAGLLSPSESDRLFRRGTDTAASMWPDDPKLFGSRALIALWDSNFAAAARFLERALAGAPKDFDILGTAQFIAVALNRQEDAITIGEYILARDPLCYYCYINLARAYWNVREYDDAERVYIVARSLGLDQWEMRLGYAYTLNANGKPAAALAEMKALELPSVVPRWLELERLELFAFARWDLGLKDEFEDTFDAMKEWDVPGMEIAKQVNIADVYAYIGEIDTAIDTLLALPLENLGIRFLDGTRGDALRKNERWQEIGTRIGIFPNDPRDAVDFHVSLPQ